MVLAQDFANKDRLNKGEDIGYDIYRLWGLKP